MASGLILVISTQHSLDRDESIVTLERELGGNPLRSARIESTLQNGAEDSTGEALAVRRLKSSLAPELRLAPGIVWSAE